ncbi:pyridoxine/pyridoxamine 5'-phosphate oxidase [Jeotgalibacillus aurantiacus]|uniref:pyridoxine/pyridoxamine 5'-phosphate oxidase n=1 Tax=Jeotgalibacillus aurantiacus TaxID=2763266 RepID=UPI001D0BC4C7|nr:pyridoxal 5'-phosphate synthase [Jeotgalibacillus aurantiacus]
MGKDVREQIRNSKTLLGPFPEFKVEQSPASPMDLFLEWFQVALDYHVHEPHAMTLSTVDADGRPDARVLSLKDTDEESWYFATGTGSEKGRQLDGNPAVCLSFYWSEVGRQIRIRGQAVKMNEEFNARDFLKRGKMARAIALTGNQSKLIDSQSAFEGELNRQLLNLEKDPAIIAKDWTVYRVQVSEVEFWQADEERLHIRLKYFLQNGQWVKKRLAP